MTINIVDVIITKTTFSQQIFVVVDRMPEWVYARKGTRFTANDDGVYYFMSGTGRKGDAFGGRQFSIKLDDGSDFLCMGDVWACEPDPDVEPTLPVGISTIEKLEKCYVFSSANVSRKKIEYWLANNTPSNDYKKYDPRETIEFWEKHYFENQKNTYGFRAVSPKRARKLRKNGVRLLNVSHGVRAWNPYFERKKKQIAERKNKLGAE